MTDPSGKFLYFAHVGHDNERVLAENVLEFSANRGMPAREIVLNLDGRFRGELGECLADALAIVSPNWHLDHSCVGERIFLDVAAEAGVPVVQWFLDHPSARWPDFVYTNATNSRFLFESAYSESYFRRFILPDCMSGWAAATGPSHHSRAGGLTHEAFRSRDIRCLVPLNVRRIAGTIEEIEHKKNLLPSAIRGAVKEAIEFACYDLEEPIEASLLSANPDGLMDEPGLLHVCVHLVEEAVQLWRRLRVFAIARDFPVLLQSDIASRYLEVSGPARLEEGISLKQTLGRMLRARAVISLTHVNDQLHNRTLNALNAGAITIIEDNKIHREIFSHGENALLFRYNDSSLWEALSLVCSDPERAFRIAEAGFAMRDDPRLRFGKFDNLLALAGR